MKGFYSGGRDGFIVGYNPNFFSLNVTHGLCRFPLPFSLKIQCSLKHDCEGEKKPKAEFAVIYKSHQALWRPSNERFIAQRQTIYCFVKWKVHLALTFMGFLILETWQPQAAGALEAFLGAPEFSSSTLSCVWGRGTLSTSQFPWQSPADWLGKALLQTTLKSNSRYYRSPCEGLSGFPL